MGKEQELTEDKYNEYLNEWRELTRAINSDNTASADRQYAKERRRAVDEIIGRHKAEIEREEKERQAAEQEKYARSFRGRASALASGVGGRASKVAKGASGLLSRFRKGETDSKGAASAPATTATAAPSSGGATATTQRNISFNPRLLLEQHKSKFKWILLFLIIALIISGFLIGWEKTFAYATGYLGTGLALLAFLWIILWGLFGEGHDDSSMFIAVAFIVWLLDMIPENLSFGWLGKPYAGFEFNAMAIVNSNWITIFTSGIILLGLAIAGLKGFTGKAKTWQFAVSLTLFWAITKFLEKSYFASYTTEIKYLGWVLLAFCVICFSLAFYYRDNLSSDLAEYLTFLFMILVFSFFYVNSNWWYTRAIYHMAYILAFGFLYIRDKERDKPSNWHLWIPALLILDFYGYNLLWNTEMQFFQSIPVLILLVVWYCNKQSPTLYTKTVAWLILIIMVGLMWPTAAFASQSIPFEAKEGVNFKDYFGQFKDRIVDVIEGRFDIATAGLYSGNVEKNRYESLGVYFSNLRAADPKFYTDEPITLWGTIRSKTYQDAVVINFTCYRIKDDKRIKADRVIPKTKFPIFTFDEIDTECTFYPSNENQIPSGINMFTFSAEYNFGTDAYLKAYFIDRDRVKAYARENIDPLTALGVKDNSPQTIFTNGPVAIGMEIKPLVTVDEGYMIYPTVGITLSNREEIENKENKVITRWEGRIKNITELILLTPPNVVLPYIGSCISKDEEESKLCPCSVPFIPYDADKCKTTCKDTVITPCNEACMESYKDDTDGSKSCIDDCKISGDKCENECEYLFKPEGEDFKGTYNGYALDVGSLKFKDLNKDIDKHRSFLCRFNPSSEVLDDTPLTTRYFRVRARYNYVVENSVSVSVEKSSLETIIGTNKAFFGRISKSAEPLKDTEYDNAGLTPDLLLAIAYVETGLKHCCTRGYGGAGQKCALSEVENCPPEMTITSGTSYGLMQVRYDKGDIKNEVDNRVRKVCQDGQTIFDLDCNIEVGKDILMEKYNTYKDGCKASSVYKVCTDPNKRKDYPTFCNGCENSKYSSYRGMDAAIRAYNGWGITSNYDTNYVEKVRAAERGIKNGEIIDTSIQRYLASRVGQGMELKENIESDSKSEDIELTIKPVSLSYDTSIRTITVGWSKSQYRDVIGYTVKRSSTYEPEKTLCTAQEDNQPEYSCTDAVETAGLYTYSVFANINDGTSAIEAKGTISVN